MDIRYIMENNIVLISIFTVLKLLQDFIQLAQVDSVVFHLINEV